MNWADSRLTMLMVFATDLDEAKRFYADVLQMTVVSEAADRVLFSYANGNLVVFRCEKNGGVGDYANEARSVFVFEVPSIDSAIRDLRKRGARVLHNEPARNEMGRYAAFADPFGSVHELLEKTTG